jgi:hypothetical protein
VTVAPLTDAELEAARELAAAEPGCPCGCLPPDDVTMRASLSSLLAEVDRLRTGIGIIAAHVDQTHPRCPVGVALTVAGFADAEPAHFAAMAATAANAERERADATMERNAAWAERDAAIAERDTARATVLELTTRAATSAAERDEAIAKLNRCLSMLVVDALGPRRFTPDEVERVIASTQLREQIDAVTADRDEARRQLAAMRTSSDDPEPLTTEQFVAAVSRARCWLDDPGQSANPTGEEEAAITFATALLQSVAAHVDNAAAAAPPAMCGTVDALERVLELEQQLAAQTAVVEAAKAWREADSEPAMCSKAQHYRHELRTAVDALAAKEPSR